LEIRNGCNPDTNGAIDREPFPKPRRTINNSFEPQDMEKTASHIPKLTPQLF
jgi:hypothetical protein